MGTEEVVRRHFVDSIEVKQKLLHGRQVGLIAQVAQEIVKALEGGNKVILLGNGGSAADAQHLAAEFVGRYRLDRRPLPAISLTTNTSSLTAISNDYAFDLAFARQLEALGKPGDVVIGISTSGKSRNVVAALQHARSAGMMTVCLTGHDGGHLTPIVHYCICVPSDSTPLIQEAHILIGHVLCELVEQAMFAP